MAIGVVTYPLLSFNSTNNVEEMRRAAQNLFLSNRHQVSMEDTEPRRGSIAPSSNAVRSLSFLTSHNCDKCIFRRGFEAVLLSHTAMFYRICWTHSHWPLDLEIGYRQVHTLISMRLYPI